jgi:hypothetical protein
MTLLIIPILIDIAAGALSRGLGTAIARWSAGNIVKEFVATKVAEKAIEEGRKIALQQSDRWQSSFTKDPGEAFRRNVETLMQEKDQNNAQANPELVDSYRQQLIQNVGQEVMRRGEQLTYGQKDTILEFDRDAVADRAVEGVLSRGLALAQPQDDSNIRKPLDQPLNGKFQGVDRGRSLATYADNPANDENTIRIAARSAFDESFDDRELTRTIVGTDDSVQRAVQRPIEDMAAEAFDINEDMSS